MGFESKQHESTFYWSDFDELGVVGKLALSAIERRQHHHQPSDINAFYDHVLIFGHFHAEKLPKYIKIVVFLVEKNRPKMTKNQNMATKRINIGRLMIILVSFNS